MLETWLHLQATNTLIPKDIVDYYFIDVTGEDDIFSKAAKKKPAAKKAAPKAKAAPKKKAAKKASDDTFCLDDSDDDAGASVAPSARATTGRSRKPVTYNLADSGSDSDF